MGNLGTFGLKGEAVFTRRKEVLVIAVGITADNPLNRTFALHANAKVAAELARKHKEVHTTQADNGALERERKIVMGDGVIERLGLDTVEFNLAIELDLGNRLGKTGRHALDLGDATTLAKIAIAAVASSAHDHGRIVPEARGELFTGKAGKLTRELRTIGPDASGMHRPVHKARKWLAFGIEERNDNDLIVGEFAWDDAVVIETGDDLLAQAANRGLRIGAALLKALANGIEEPSDSSSRRIFPSTSCGGKRRLKYGRASPRAGRNHGQCRSARRALS